MKFLIVVVIAIVVEGITEYLKQMIPELGNNTKIILAVTVALGVVTAISFKADIFTALGFEATIPYIGCVLTGILCARGSNYVFDLIGKFTDSEDMMKELECSEHEAYVPADEVNGREG